MDIINQNKDRRTRRKPAIDLSTTVYGKLPPQARELEEAVLGAVMLEKSAFDTIVEILKPECFYTDEHQRIFKAFQNLAQREGHSRSETDRAERCAAQIAVGFEFLRRHDGLAQSVDEAADDHEIEALLDRRDRRVGSAAGDFQRTAGQYGGVFESF